MISEPVCVKLGSALVSLGCAIHKKKVPKLFLGFGFKQLEKKKKKKKNALFSKNQYKAPRIRTLHSKGGIHGVQKIWGKSRYDMSRDVKKRNFWHVDPPGEDSDHPAQPDQNLPWWFWKAELKTFLHKANEDSEEADEQADSNLKWAYKF